MISRGHEALGKSRRRFTSGSSCWPAMGVPALRPFASLGFSFAGLVSGFKVSAILGLARLYEVI